MVKKAIKKLLIGKQEIKYNSLVESKKMDYEKWVNIVESKEIDKFSCFHTNENSLTIETAEMLFDTDLNKNDGQLAEDNKLCKLIESFDPSDPIHTARKYLLVEEMNLYCLANYLKNAEQKIDYVIFINYPGRLSNSAVSKIHSEFIKNKDLILIYGDEDIVNADGKRENPWYKPDWAPDDFLSYFYFGGVVAIKAEELLNMKVSKEDNIYRLIYKILLLNNGFDCHDIKKADCIRHIPSILFHSKQKSGYLTVKEWKLDNPIKERESDSLISVIIPSKDHPDVLFRCIDSFINVTELLRLKYEFIIVDNGSSDANRSIIEDILSSYKAHNNMAGIEYIYEKKEFNFSYMCNLGARASKGDFLLFLNDDIEVLEKDWLYKLYEKANLPYAGAVGAKLIYPPGIQPQGDIIQHAGITNLRIGPAHKLQFMSDSEDHYFGRNRYCHDMMGVTGACLMLKKSIFDEVGGFDENLAVAFNDVDLCYSIYEHGYYNIERNDIRLYHHESLSRGDDAASKEKMLRLTGEKDYLYRKHQDLYGRDPFYNINLTTDMLEQEYAPRYHYEVKLDNKWAQVSDITSVIESAREDRCLRVGMESAMDIYKWKYGVSEEYGKVPPTEEDKGFYFQGYTFVIGSNNACFERTLLMKNLNTQRIYGIAVNVEYRPDIRDNLKDQLNVDLTGYTAKIRATDLPEGEYQFGMYMKDNTSSLRLVNYSNWTLTV